jgi:glyoxylase-like metal-dependent hydrolase (beta-lactamase superfamily II)
VGSPDRPEDVRRIVVTHLDLDHAGGFGDFPHADVHVLADELDAARRRATIRERVRYRSAQWTHGPHWVTHRADGELWFDFTAIPLTDDILLIPLIGHTRGHTGVAVRQGDRWLLHCGDTYYHHDQLTPGHSVPPLWPIFQWLNDAQPRARRENLARLQALGAEHQDEVTLFCAHDAYELAALRSDREHGLR